MIVDISSNFKRNPPIITTLKPGHIYTDEKGEDYIFLGLGGYNRLLYNGSKASIYEECPDDDDWVIWEINGDAPYLSCIGDSPIYMYVKVTKLLKLLGTIPNTYQELFEEIFDKGYFSTEVYASKKPRRFVKEKDLVLRDMDKLEKIIVEYPNVHAYSFKFVEKLS